MERIFSKSNAFQELSTNLRNVIPDHVITRFEGRPDLEQDATKLREYVNSVISWTRDNQNLEFRNYHELMLSDADFMEMYNGTKLRDETTVRVVYARVCKEIASKIVTIICPDSYDFFDCDYYGKNFTLKISDFKKRIKEILRISKKLSNVTEDRFDGLCFKDYNKMSKLLKEVGNSSYKSEKDIASDTTGLAVDGQFDGAFALYYSDYIAATFISAVNDALLVISECMNSKGNFFYSFSWVPATGVTVDDSVFENKNVPGQKIVKNKLSNVNVENLFGPSGEPKASDIKQGELKDCFLETVLQTLAKKHPQFIRDSIRIETRGDKEVFIFSVYPVSMRGTKIVRGGNSRVSFEFPATVLEVGNDSSKPAWVKGCEKGTAIAKSKGCFADTRFNHLIHAFTDGGNILKKISDGGYSSIYYTAFTGKENNLINNDTVNTIKQFQKLPYIFSKHSCVTISFDQNFTVPAIFGFPKGISPIILTPENYNSKISIFSAHGYSVMGDGQKYVNKHTDQFNNQKDLKGFTGKRSYKPEDLLLLRNSYGNNLAEYEYNNETLKNILRKGSFLVWWVDIKSHLQSFSFESIT